MKRLTPKNLFKLFLKLAFVAGVFYFLAQKNLISLDAFRSGMNHWEYLGPGVLALVLASLISAYRWQLLLKAQDLKLPFSRTTQLSYIGAFFNVALPGAVSGDFVKAFYVGQEVHGHRAKAFGSILFDRIVGISALVMVSVGALALEFQTFVGTPVLSGIKAFILLTGSCVFVFYAYLFLVQENRDPILFLLKKLEGKLSKLNSVTRIYLGVRHYHHAKGSVLLALALSVMIHLLAGFACIEFAYALGETHLTASGIYVVVPLGLLVTAVPVLPGGVGTGHAAFSFFFQLLSSQRGADVFSFFVITQLLIGVSGGLIYLKFKSKNPKLMAHA